MSVKSKTNHPKWQAGKAPVAVVMISLNEGHNMAAVLDNISGWAQEVFLVDSYSSDDTVDLALARGVQVFQRPFKGFGDQWNYATSQLPVSASWILKLDPDERLSEDIKTSIQEALIQTPHNGFNLKIRLWFLGKKLPATLTLLRLWRRGAGHWSDVDVNEHLIIDGEVGNIDGDIEHHDSPHLHHWLAKQNKYTTAEAVATYSKADLAQTPRFFGNKLERRMWLKQTYWKLPFRHHIMFSYCYLIQGAWRCGREGYIWSRLRSDVYRFVEYKTYEMRKLDAIISVPKAPLGSPHTGAVQAEN